MQCACWRMAVSNALNNGFISTMYSELRLIQGHGGLVKCSTKGITALKVNSSLNNLHIHLFDYHLSSIPSKVSFIIKPCVDWNFFD